MPVNKVHEEEWKYPPTKSRKTMKAERSNDIISIIHLETDLFPYPVIMMSDLHQHGYAAVSKLMEQYDLSQFIVISAGDMAGKGYYGDDADPLETYKLLAENAKSFFFVQGNHDLPSNRNEHLYLKNRDGTKCMLPNGRVVKSIIGNIAGINGIMSRSKKQRNYRIMETDYLFFAEKSLKNKIDVFVTHETPALPVVNPQDNESLESNVAIKTLIGQNSLFSLVDKYKPRVHIYGHCYHSSYHHLINGVNYLNADGRIIIASTASR